MKIAYISTYLPRQCGIATFTNDLLESVKFNSRSENIIQHVYAMKDDGYGFPSEVVFSIGQHNQADYLEAASIINKNEYDCCVLEHEYGIFGGNSGLYILSLIKHLHIPLIVNLHTILNNPSVDERAILLEIAHRASKLVVMSRNAIQILREVYNIPESKIEYIAHGTPDFKSTQEEAKNELTLENKKIILTFGFIGRSKGIDIALRALPAVVSRHPDVLYIILGKTHPNILKNTGEEYRTYLEDMVDDLGLENNVLFINKFVDDDTLAKYLSACDVYITPYVNESQITSGTLSFAMGAGAAIISTPYWHAKDLLSEGRGLLFDFKDYKRLSSLLLGLFDKPESLILLRKKAYKFGKTLSWKKIGALYLQLYHKLSRQSFAAIGVHGLLEGANLPSFDVSHVRRLTNGVGIIQHATYATPNYHEGYCLDDNARALLLILTAREELGYKDVDDLISTYISYIYYAQRKDGKFRNFMSFSNVFLDKEGSEDSFGRAIWALGRLFQSSPNTSFYQIGKEMFDRAVPHFNNLISVRAVAYTILGVCSYLKHQPNDEKMLLVLKKMVDYLISEFNQNSDNDWIWFEKIISYDNAILPLAMLKSTVFLNDSNIKKIGLQTLKFLESIIFKNKHLTPIGNQGWYKMGNDVPKFGQQPIEVTTVILLFHEAYEITKQEKYFVKTIDSFRWFFGHNELQLSLYDWETKGCCDGLESYGINRNQGAESTICFWLAYASVRRILQSRSTAKSSENTSILRGSKAVPLSDPPNKPLHM